MPNTFTPTAAALVTVTEPVDGELESAASATTMTRPIANGVAWVQDRTNVLADITALAAILAPVDGLVRHVLGQGFYTFKTAATTGISPFRVAAGDATPGGWESSTAHQETVTRRLPCSLISSISGTAGGALAQVNGSTATILFVPLAPGDGQREGGSFYCNRTFTGATNYQAYFIPLDEFMIDGADLDTATLYFRPITGHAGLPTRMPKWTICRVPITGYVPTIQNLSSLTFTALVAPGSAALYEADQSILWVNDIAKPVDRTTYRYFAVILDDAGTNAIVGNAYHAIDLNFINVDARRS